ncbi:MAG: hypothetical protein FJY86_02675 [Candidatus Diapherotrites archaeon]|uniref:Uncharacterized protein n=1 Tax=Candidatus Iainarchaeum sp. TaxID=3101447 RepID=A0A8T4C718_9ARCH|nr:hypothetical protein [Candidatus Diapherotrites archaeon]
MRSHYYSTEKGFTLFTALLSFVLILLAGLLINTMINAERTSNEVVLEVEAQSRMQSLADLTRADALQVVNYGIRNAIEEYSQNQGNAYPYSSQTFAGATPSAAWQNVQNDFSNFFFGQGNGSILAGRIASNLYVIVQSNPRTISGYTISTKGGQEPEIKQAIQSVLAQTNTTTQNFLQVVKCDHNTAPDKCVGSFYVNMDFSLLSDVEYEKLPAIHVYDEATKRELVEPVIPRGKFRIYVPLRIFKSLKYAHEIAQGQLAGLLSQEFHDNLGKLGVGMCDGVDTSGEVICGYRTAPFTTASLSAGPNPPASPITGGNLCPSEQSAVSVIENNYPKNVPLICDAVADQLNLCNAGQVVANYNPSEAPSRAAALAALVQQFINSHVTISLNNIVQTNDFQLLTNQIDIQPSVSSFATKDILFEGLKNISPTEGKCTKLVNTNVTLKFQENNLNYIVVDSRAPLHYDVRIVDSFVQNQSKTTCVSYCTSQSTLGQFINPDLDPASAVCSQTACSQTNDPNYPILPTCGNGIVNFPSEECEPGMSFTLSDGTTATCGNIQQNFDHGQLGCNDQTCKFDTTACTRCGNNQIESPFELCDGSNIGTATCASLFPATPNGVPSCKSDCSGFDIGTCA